MNEPTAIDFTPEMRHVRNFAKSLMRILSERSKAHAENAHPFHDKFGDKEELMIGLRARSSECENLESVVRREAEKYLRELYNAWRQR